MRHVKRFKLRSGKRPQRHHLLSGVVHVHEPEGVGFAYVKFDECFVDAVGKALPFGLTPTTPAYLKLLYMPGRKVWRLFAMYLNQSRGVLLWEADARPEWIGPVFRD